ncbi:MAG: hypothetical protein K9J17_13515 [Flavobacteriales bacterium]|nr:hypothetical protein [Flavobacteriales bacterium]
MIGYHGTDNEKVASILSHNFWESTSRDEWFGSGSYFFVEGVNDSALDKLAELWGVNESWDKNKRRNKYTDVAVLSAKIKVEDDKLLDVTVLDGLKLFNRFREQVLDKVRLTGKRLSKEDYRDADVFEMIKKNIGVQFVKGNAYIKLGDLRVSLIESRMPNCTILAVSLPLVNIEQASITLVKTCKTMNYEF